MQNEIRKQKLIKTLVLTFLCLNLVRFPLVVSNGLTSLSIAGEKANADVDWLPDYVHRKQFNVTGSVSGNVTNCTIFVTVFWGSGTDSESILYLGGIASKNFQDVRFTQSDGESLLNATRENCYWGDKATFAVKVPSIPASPRVTTLYVYYGNPKVCWEKHENVIFQNEPTREWENYSVRAPSIVWNGTHYCMFYAGASLVAPKTKVSAIGLASSTDGINWIRENNGDPVLSKTGTGWEGYTVASPTVLYVDGTYHMWYCGWHYTERDFFNNPRARIGYANSTDGINWTRGPNNPIIDIGRSGKFDDEDVGWYSAVILDDNGNYTMLYVGYSDFATGLATSAYPWKDWIKLNDGNPVLSPTEAWEQRQYSELSVRGLVKINGTYYAVYVAGSGRWDIPHAHNLGLAKSTDRINWTRDAANPVLETWNGLFDRTQIQDPVFVKMQDTGKWRIYYTATDGSAWEKYTMTFAETAETTKPIFLADVPSGQVLNNGDNTYQIFADFDKSMDDDGAKEGFKTQSGVWTVKEENLDTPFDEANFFYEGYGLTGTATSLYDSKNKNQTDFAIEVKTRLASADISSGNYSIIFRWQDSNNYYKIQYLARFRGENEKLALTRMVEGSSTEIASYSLATDRNWHTIKILVNDTNCKVFFDGKQRIPSSGWKNLGSEFLSGKIGFQVFRARTHFDDLKVYKYIEPEPSALGIEEVLSKGLLFAIILSFILIVLALWIAIRRKGKGASSNLLREKREFDFFATNFGPRLWGDVVFGNYLFRSLYILVRRFFLILFVGRERRNNYLRAKYGSDEIEAYISLFLNSLPKSVAFAIQAKVVSNPSAIAVEKNITSFLCNLKGGLFVDVGASVGHYSLMLHTNFRQVIAFEPFGPTAKTLRQNIYYSKIKNVKVVEMAVSDEDGTAVLRLSSHPDCHSLLGSSEGIQVRTCSLASFFKNEDAIDLAKVDVEGGEWKVLKGAEPILDKINSWVVELHDRERKKEIEEWFTSRGYSIRWLDVEERTSHWPHIYAWRETAFGQD